jgi:hypothetical protein
VALTLAQSRVLERVLAEGMDEVRVREERHGRLHRLRPAQKRHVIEGLDDGTFDVRHLLEVDTVLNIVRVEDGDPTVDDHVLGMESAHDRPVVVLRMHEHRECDESPARSP